MMTFVMSWSFFTGLGWRVRGHFAASREFLFRVAHSVLVSTVSHFAVSHLEKKIISVANFPKEEAVTILTRDPTGVHSRARR